MKRCEKCGTELLDHAKFCVSCGAPCESASNPLESQTKVLPSVAKPQEDLSPIGVNPKAVDPAATQRFQSADLSATKPLPAVAEADLSETKRFPVPVGRRSKKRTSTVEISSDPSEVLKRFTHAEEEPQKPKKVRRIVIISTCLLLAALLCAGGLLLAHYFSPMQQLLRTWDSGNYSHTLTILRDNPSLKSDETLEESLQQRISAIKTEFHDGSVDYAQATKALDALEKMQISGLKKQVSKTRDYVEQLQTSRQHFADGEKAMEQQVYMEARELFRQVITEDSNYNQAQEKIRQCEERHRNQVVDLASSQVTNQQYVEAIRTLDNGLKDLPDDEILSQRRSEYEALLADHEKNTLLQEAAALAQEQDYLGAITLLDESGIVDPSMSTLREEYLTQYVSLMVSTASNLSNEGQFPLAIETILDARDHAPDNISLSNALETIIGKVIAASDQAIEQGDYDKAVQVVEDAHALLPKNKRLAAQLKTAQAAKPEYLMDVSVAYDEVGCEEYSNGFSLTQGGYCCYNISGKYKTLKFKAGHVVGSGQSNGVLCIYLDSALAQTIPLTPNTAPAEFELDITGTRQLKFTLQPADSTAELDSTCLYGVIEITVK